MYGMGLRVGGGALRWIGPGEGGGLTHDWEAG